MSRLVRPPRDFQFVFAGQVAASDASDEELKRTLIVYKRLLEFLMGNTLGVVLASNAENEITIQPSALREGH